MLDPLPFLELHSLGVDCFGHPFFVYGEGGGPARNCVQEEGLQILHVHSGTLGLYLWFVTSDVIRKPFGGRSEKNIKPTFTKNVSSTFYNRDIYFMFYQKYDVQYMKKFIRSITDRSIFLLT